MKFTKLKVFYILAFLMNECLTGQKLSYKEGEIVFDKKINKIKNAEKITSIVEIEKRFPDYYKRELKYFRHYYDELSSYYFSVIKGDITGDGKDELFFFSSYPLYRIDIFDSEGSRMPYLSASGGANLFLCDLDNDNIFEIITIDEPRAQSRGPLLKNLSIK